MPSARGKIAGIIGWPVSHSLSPRLHSYWLAQYNIDGSYIPMPVAPDDLALAIKALPKMGFSGANVTIPHKETVLALLDEIDETAKLIGAVNTIVITEDGKLHGSNSDAYGFIKNVRPVLSLRKEKAVVLGAGGAAKAVCKALIDEGFGDIVVINRTRARAESLAAQFKGKLTLVEWDKRSEALDGADILVNTTSLGLAGNEPLDIALDALPKSALVTDIVYKPLDTPLLQQARSAGHPAVDGLGMLIHQAVPGFEAWFGVRPEVTADIRQQLLSE